MSCRRAWASLALACLACVDLRPPKLEQSAGTIDQAKAVDAPKWVGLDARERGVGWHVHDLIHDRMGYALDSRQRSTHGASRPPTRLRAATG